MVKEHGGILIKWAQGSYVYGFPYKILVQGEDLLGRGFLHKPPLRQITGVVGSAAYSLASCTLY